MAFLISPHELAQAGFLPAVGLPSGTAYEQHLLYVCLTPRGTLRLYLPEGHAALVEISSGSLYDPIVHYAGPVASPEQLLRLVQAVRTGPPAYLP